MTKNSQRPSDWQSIVEEFQHTSDRSVVILGSSYLKNHLGRLIKCYLVDDENTISQLLGPEAPLGTFGARIRAAYGMGLISPNEYHDLTQILHIYNSFQTSLDQSKLTDDQNRTQCYALRIPREVLLSGETPTPRRLFEFDIALLSGQLIVRAGQAECERRIPPENFMLVDVER